MSDDEVTAEDVLESDEYADDDGYLTPEGARVYLAMSVGEERYLTDPLINQLVEQQARMYSELVEAEKRLECEGITPPRKARHQRQAVMRERAKEILNVPEATDEQ